MRNDLKITIHFDHFCYHNDNYEWTNEMPYFWFSFFKIDGTFCKINEALQLEGTVELITDFNHIECLGNIEPDTQDVLKIPLKLGRKELKLKPIPLPEFTRKTELKNVESYMGCIAVLMNEECALNDEKGNYTTILNDTIHSSLNELIPVLKNDPKKLQLQLKLLKNKIESKITNESQRNQSFWKRLTSENLVDATIWLFSSDEIHELNKISLAKFWGSEGLWELSGNINADNFRPAKIPKMKVRKKQTLENI